MRRELILNVIHISGNRKIEAGIDGLSRGDKLGGMMRRLNPQFVPLYLGLVVR